MNNFTQKSIFYLQRYYRLLHYLRFNKKITKKNHYSSNIFLIISAFLIFIHVLKQ